MISSTRSFLSAAVGLLLLASTPFVSAQVTTDCQPLEKSCPADPAFSMSHSWAFNSTPNGWDIKVKPVTFSNENGATFTITNQGDSPTIRTQYYIFFGRVEMMMKAAPGVGIISSIMLLSDDLDEIDWEILGINSTHALSNYFGKGAQVFTNGGAHLVNGNLQDAFHNYTTIWTKDKLEWYLDGALVRTLLPKDANNTLNYPQTPSRLSIGIWAGGDPRMSEGTRQWAGGDTDYGAGPFSMHVKDVKIEDYSSGKEYVYGDNSGTWQSIQVIAGQSTANETVNAVIGPSPPAESIADKWNKLSSGAKIGIYAGAGSVVALIGISLFVYFIKQRRRGAREAKLAEERQNQERLELEQYRKAGIDPDALVVQQSEYSKDMSIPSTPVDPSGPLSEKSSSSWSDGRGNLNPAAGAGVAAAGIAASGGMRSPAPLLRNDGNRSPGPHSPMGGGPGGMGMGMYQDNPRSRQGSLGPHGNSGMVSPLRTPSPGMAPQYPLPSAPGSPGPGQHMQQQMHQQQQGRSFTAPMPRMASPGPGPHGGGGGGYGQGMQRMNSPAPMVGGPQRSFSSDPYQSHGHHQGGGGGYGGNGGYGGGGGGGGHNGGGYWR